MTEVPASLFRQVERQYIHRPKQARPGPPLVAPDVYLKWHLVEPMDRPLSESDVAEAQAFVLEQISRGHLKLKDEVGFVVQHRASAADILYVCSWRYNNEVWETIFSKDARPGNQFRVAQRELTTGTFCVWVVPIVAHEQQAWAQYLRSARDADARLRYCHDMYTGSVG